MHVLHSRKGAYYLLAGLFILLLSPTSESQMSISPPPSPHPNVRAISLSQDSAVLSLSGVTMPQIELLGPNAFVIHNDDDRQISGICAIWTITNTSGKTITWTFMMDQFSSTVPNVVVGPHNTVLLTEVGWIPTSEISKHAAALGRDPGLQRRRAELLAASHVGVSLDSIIFADGAVWGPNKAHLDQEILGRKAAAIDLVSRISDVQSSGGDLNAALTAMVRLPFDPHKDFQSKWTSRLAQQALTSGGNVSRWLQYWSKLPSPPQFSYPH